MGRRRPAGRQRAFESNPDRRGESGSDRTSGFACRLWANRFWAELPTAREELVVQLHRPLDQRVLMVEDLGFLRAIGIQQDQDGRTLFLGEADADERRWRGPYVREPQHCSSYRLARVPPAIGFLTGGVRVSQPARGSRGGAGDGDRTRDRGSRGFFPTLAPLAPFRYENILGQQLPVILLAPAAPSAH